ncbi:MAG TPA: cell division protein ZapE [Steroidobacteraceae bacterium]|nr:cell division protein ZapE [Steroidobacteraceae bacterium]
MSGAFPSVESRLEAEVAAHRLEADAAQLAAAARLDDLAAALARAGRGVGTRLRTALASWAQRALPTPGRHPAAAPPRGLYLWGGVGRGKTLLMDWFYQSLGFPDRKRTHFYRFMREVHGELGRVERRANPLEAVGRRLAASRVICLDELFVSDIGDAMILSGLLESLFRHGVTLVATSNTPPRDLYQDGLQRQRFLPAIDLIEQHLDVLHLDGGVDYRLRRLERSSTYLESGDPGTDGKLRRLFAALAGEPASGPAQIEIEGRPIAVLAAAPGMAWFEFADLCEGPRSQNDYIELARLYQTLFVSRVPVLTVGDEDAARRFVMLIDELYDRGVKLVLSAAAPPNELYRGERLAFEFERAASRLIEMQTQSYLAGRHRP